MLTIIITHIEPKSNTFLRFFEKSFKICADPLDKTQDLVYNRNWDGTDRFNFVGSVCHLFFIFSCTYQFNSNKFYNRRFAYGSGCPHAEGEEAL